MRSNNKLLRQRSRKLLLVGALSCTFASLFYAYSFLVRVTPSAITSQLMAHFNIGAGKLGLLSSIFYYAYALMQIPSGLLFDRFSARKVLTLMTLLCAAGVAIFAASTILNIAMFGRFLIGFSASSASIGGLVLAARWFPNKYTFVIGIMQMLGCIGAVLGQRPVAIAVEHFDWQVTLYGSCIIGFLLAILIWIFVRDKPKTDNVGSQPKHNHLNAKNLRLIFQNKQNYYLFAYGFTIWAPLTIFASLWGVPFLAAKLNVSNVTAATMTSLTWIGMAINGPIIGWLSDHFKKRTIFMLLSAIIGLVSSLLIIYVSGISLVGVGILLLLFGASTSGMAMTFGLLNDSNPPVIIGLATSILNLAMVLGGMLFQPLAGFILSLFWDGKMLENAPIYNLTAYHYGLALIPLCFLICLILSAFFLKESAKSDIIHH